MSAPSARTTFPEGIQRKGFGGLTVFATMLRPRHNHAAKTKRDFASGRHAGLRDRNGADAELFHQLAHGDRAQKRKLRQVVQSLRPTLLAFVQKRL